MDCQGGDLDCLVVLPISFVGIAIDDVLKLNDGSYITTLDFGYYGVVYVADNGVVTGVPWDAIQGKVVS